MSQPDVSVLMPVYNGLANYPENALREVLGEHEVMTIARREIAAGLIDASILTARTNTPLLPRKRKSASASIVLINTSRA